MHFRAIVADRSSRLYWLAVLPAAPGATAQGFPANTALVHFPRDWGRVLLISQRPGTPWRASSAVPAPALADQVVGPEITHGRTRLGGGNFTLRH
jgi:hypothetical protein